jgi:hypothetical protein
MNGDPKRTAVPACYYCGRDLVPGHSDRCVVLRALRGPAVPVELFPVVIALLMVGLWLFGRLA